MGTAKNDITAEMVSEVNHRRFDFEILVKTGQRAVKRLPCIREHLGFVKEMLFGIGQEINRWSFHILGVWCG